MHQQQMQAPPPPPPPAIEADIYPSAPPLQFIPPSTHTSSVYGYKQQTNCQSQQPPPPPPPYYGGSQGTPMPPLPHYNHSGHFYAWTQSAPATTSIPAARCEAKTTSSSSSSIWEQGTCWTISRNVVCKENTGQEQKPILKCNITPL